MHPLLRMAQRLEALGRTEVDVLARMGLEVQEVEVRLLRDELKWTDTAPSEAPHVPQRQAGVGLELGKSDEGVSITGFVRGCAAANSNSLLKGDVLVEIDGQLVGDELVQVEKLLSGDQGSVVTVKVKRSTVRVLLMHRRDLLSRLVAAVKPLRRVLLHVIRACAQQVRDLPQRSAPAPSPSLSAVFRYNAAADTGFVDKLGLDPMLCSILLNYELQLFGASTLNGLDAYVLKALALLPAAEAQRLSARDVEYSVQSKTIRYFVEQLVRKVAPGSITT